MRKYLKPSTFAICHLGFSPKAQPCPQIQGASSAEITRVLPSRSNPKGRDACPYLNSSKVLVSKKKKKNNYSQNYLKSLFNFS